MGVITHYMAIFGLAIFVIIVRYDDMYYDYERSKFLIWRIFWDLGILIFGSFQLWILTRAMHPVASNCGCVMDGSGDGNYNVSSSVPPQQIVMVVQQPQTMQTVVVQNN